MAIVKVAFSLHAAYVAWPMPYRMDRGRLGVGGRQGAPLARHVTAAARPSPMLGGNALLPV